MPNRDTPRPGEPTPSGTPPPQDGRQAEASTATKFGKVGKTYWHYPYAALLRERMPPGWVLDVEHPLSLAPRTADLLLLRSQGSEHRDHEARVMRGLWQHLTDVVLLEFKSPSAGLRPRDLSKLLSYGWEYLSQPDCRAYQETDLSLVLVVPRDSRTLSGECQRWNLEREPLGNGYVRLLGKGCTILVVLLDQVAEAEHGDFLRVFTPNRAQIRDASAIKWIHSRLREVLSMEELKKLDEYEELVAGFIDLFGPEAVLSQFEPEQRLAGLSPEEMKRLRAALDEQLNS